MGLKKKNLLKYIKDTLEKNGKSSNLEEKEKIYDDNKEDIEEECDSNTDDERNNNSSLSPEENFQFLVNNLKNISSDK
jgi:hypothetical protein